MSNTTEDGYRPGRFPALLARVLEARANADLPGVTILPCELIESNGARLLELVIADVRGRDVSSAVLDRIVGSNTWAVTLVDRIATSPAGDDPAARG